MFELLQQLASVNVHQSPPTLNQLQQWIGGTVVGNGHLQIKGLAHPKHRQNPEALVVLLEQEVVHALQSAGQSLETALVAEGLTLPEGLVQGALVVERPRLALGILLHLFQTPEIVPTGIHPSALIDPTATIDATAAIGPYVVIGANSRIGAGVQIYNQVSIASGVSIGDDSIIHAGVRIQQDCQLGQRVIVQSNSCIGGDGYSYTTLGTSNVEAAKSSGQTQATRQVQIKIPSIGNVILEDDVEVGACTTIDRANLGPTLIKRGTKIDNLVMIGHNNTIGEDTLVVAQAGISGSCEIGNGVTLAGQVGIKDHTKIGDNAIIMAKSGVMHDIEAGAIVVGQPAKPQRQFFQEMALIGKLADMRKELRELRQEVARLKNQSPQSEPVSV